MKNITLLFMAVVLLVPYFPCRAAEPRALAGDNDSIVDLRPLTSWQRFNRKVDKLKADLQVLEEQIRTLEDSMNQ